MKKDTNSQALLFASAGGLFIVLIGLASVMLGLDPPLEAPTDRVV